METIAIVVGVITGVAGITGATYKCYQEMQNRPQQQEIIIHEPDRIMREVPPTPPPSPVIDRIIKQAVKKHMDQVDSDGSDTEIDIRIHIHTPKYESEKD